MEQHPSNVIWTKGAKTLLKALEKRWRKSKKKSETTNLILLFSALHDIKPLEKEIYP